MRRVMSSHVAAVLLSLIAIVASQSVAARPEHLARFQADPQRRPEVDGCSTCHVARSGGGARNDFGSAFDAAGREITPLLRATFPQHFNFQTVKLGDGIVLSFTDPQSKLVVVARENQRFEAELASLTEIKSAPLPVPTPQNRMTFFVTSRGVESFAGLGGLAGADRHCQTLAADVGAEDRTWRAYLSTSFSDTPAVNAGDRIGAGPWYNARGVLLARGPADLHARDRLPPDLVLTETGEPVASLGVARVVTGTLPNGTAAVGKNCQNWTSSEGGEAIGGEPASAWNSGSTVSCSDRIGAAAASRLYCFAVK